MQAAGRPAAGACSAPRNNFTHALLVWVHTKTHLRMLLHGRLPHARASQSRCARWAGGTCGAGEDTGRIQWAKAMCTIAALFRAGALAHGRLHHPSRYLSQTSCARKPRCCIPSMTGWTPHHAPRVHQQHALQRQPGRGIQRLQLVGEQHAGQGTGRGQAGAQREAQHVHHPNEALRR